MQYNIHEYENEIFFYAISKLFLLFACENDASEEILGYFKKFQGQARLNFNCLSSGKKIAKFLRIAIVSFRPAVTSA